MQNNVTELAERLQRALGSDNNVIDMPDIIDVIAHLEKVAITKELLEITRLGKYTNELRRKLTNTDLRHRVKELMKRWRNQFLLPDSNGQINSSSGKATTISPLLEGHNSVTPAKVSPPIPISKMSKLVSPGIQRLVSPGQSGRLVSPQIPKRLNPHKLMPPSLQAHRLVSPQPQKISPNLQRTGSPSCLMDRQSADVNLNQVKGFKRTANDMENINAKRARLNGGMTDFDFSDNSNSSFKDVTSGSSSVNVEAKRESTILNSDSNSSFAERTAEPHLDQLQPKKRGRKKGSKNHKNLLDEAETSFSNKLAVSASRGGSKVKTTQEILAGIQSKNTALSTVASLKPSKEDLEEKAAKLTERVSIIDQKLNANAHRNKNSQKHKLTLSASKPNERVIESGSVINDKSLLDRLKEEENDDEDVVVVDDADSVSSRTEESQETDAAGAQPHDQNLPKSLSVEEALSQLPPIDKSVLEEDCEEPPCTCRLKENKPSAFSIGDEEEEQPPLYEIVEDPACPAKEFLEELYQVHEVSDEKILRLHESCLPNVNGNWSLGTPRPEPPKVEGLYVNVVPNIYERLDKDVRPFDSFKKYSVSEGNIKGGSPTINNSDNVIKSPPESINGGGTNESDSVIEPELNTSENNENSDIRTEKLEVFREWYECVDRSSYNEDTLRILPYCILD
ncbi:mediator of RNA polymerase II transcription subunit 26-like [Euwallacea similis]|uniref:mediator of RNA polymerase II transcription subunit 26-like n=1 Tax=Euwallacea similis TaxID=1736056 RepID=UPI00344CFFA1